MATCAAVCSRHLWPLSPSSWWCIEDDTSVKCIYVCYCCRLAMMRSSVTIWNRPACWHQTWQRCAPSGHLRLIIDHRWCIPLMLRQVIRLLGLMAGRRHVLVHTSPPRQHCLHFTPITMDQSWLAVLQPRHMGKKQAWSSWYPSLGLETQVLLRWHSACSVSAAVLAIAAGIVFRFCIVNIE